MPQSRFRSDGPWYWPYEVLGQTSIRGVPNGAPLGWPSQFNTQKACYDQLNAGPPYRSGGPLFLKKHDMIYHASPDYSITAVGGVYGYDGHFKLIIPGQTALRTTYSSASGTAASYGASAYRRCRPISPIHELGQALGELRDLPGMLKSTWNLAKTMREALRHVQGLSIRKGLITPNSDGSSSMVPATLLRYVVKRGPRGLAEDYLNYQFGWRPFLKDLSDLIFGQDAIEKRLKYLRLHNGKWTRRHGTLVNTTSSTTEEVSSMMYPALPWAFYSSVGGLSKGTHGRITKDRVWYDGSFKWHVSYTELVRSQVLWTPIRRRLAGLTVSPSTLYELMPWTWLNDWFGKYGDVIANMTDNDIDNMVTKYAYVMRTREQVDVYSQTQKLATTNGVISVRCDAKSTIVVKERAPMIWWGVGSEGSTLTPRQLSILLALGITKL